METITQQVLIRKAELGDLESVLDVMRGEIDEAYFEDIAQEVWDISAGKAECFVAEAGSEVIGYASWRKKVQVAYLETIAVKPAYQGKGVGSRLLQEVIASIKEKEPDVTLLNVITDADAPDAIKFYLKNGFAVSGLVEDEFIEKQAQVHLCLRLRSISDVK